MAMVKDRSSTHLMHQPSLAALKKAEADKNALAQQLANATANVDPDDGQAGKVDEVSTETGKKKKISHSSSDWEFQSGMQWG